MRRPNSKPAHVAVVSKNQETLTSLCSYFARVGVAATTATDLTNGSILPTETTAVVLFPDDYAPAAVETFLLSVRRARPKLFILVVTSAPQQLGGAVDPDGRSVPPVVLPKPAFGWTILDAIRGAVERSDRSRS